MILSWPLGSPRFSSQKNSSVENMLPIIPSSLLQQSLCTTGLDELLEFPVLHKGRGICPEMVGSWFSQRKGGGGVKTPLIRQLFLFIENVQYSYKSVTCRTRQLPEELKSALGSQARLRYLGNIRGTITYREEADRKRMISTTICLYNNRGQKAIYLQQNSISLPPRNWTIISADRIQTSEYYFSMRNNLTASFVSVMCLPRFPVAPIGCSEMLGQKLFEHRLEKFLW